MAKKSTNTLESRLVAKKDAKAKQFKDEQILKRKILYFENQREKDSLVEEIAILRQVLDRLRSRLGEVSDSLWNIGALPAWEEEYQIRAKLNDFSDVKAEE
jgi:hypothetical protein